MNPFNPSFGKVPPIFLDRNRLVQELAEDLENTNSPYQTTLIYGLRGSGKTSFLTDVGKKLGQDDFWIVINLAMGTDLLATLADSIYVKASNPLKKALESIGGVKFSAFGLQVEFGMQNADASHKYQTLLEMILERMQNQGVKLLVTIDEIKSTKEVRRFISIYQILIREGYSISLIMTGLPAHISELQNDDVLTFLLRSARINLDPLNPLTIKSSYQKVFSEGGRKIDGDVLAEMVKMTAGYAYAFQLLGFLVWQTGEAHISAEVLESIKDDFKLELYRNVYTKIYQELSSVDIEFIKTMAGCDGNLISIGEITQKMNKPKNYISMYRRRLLDDQIIRAPKRGYVSFTLPYFKDFILENQEFYY
ncbi:ATPase [Ligilactobacillus sp. WC1T17]|uniref:ATPase n=1 Tax=Ligilactobacillus ruminis TaxID=1623 RepID=A0ABY1AA20_9LACO|nr:ATPase [Ligilactobacillus ruminis]